jgi:hypothetical protein
MTDEKSLVPVEQKSVTFYEDDVIAVRLANGAVFVPVRPIIERLGVDWSGQRRRINRDPVLSDEIRTVDVTSTEGTRQVTRGVLCLPLDYISGFLFGLNAERVRKDLRDKVINYQRECHKVLAEAFQEGRLTADPNFDDLLASDSAAAQAFKMAQAVMSLARSQLLIESRVTAVEGRLEEIATQLADPGRKVTPAQATNISQAVKAVAMALSKASGRNEYGGVYGELYRRYEVPSYRELPASKYEDVMAWLNEWLQSVSGNQPF